MLQEAFKDDCISRSQSGRWHKAFKEGWEEIADEPRSRRPTMARIDEYVNRVRELLSSNRRLSVQQIAGILNLSTFAVHEIVTEDLQMRYVCAKLVPKVLTKDQKELRVSRCQELLDLIQNEPDFLNSVITGDESWKTMLIVFFVVRGIVHFELVPQGETFNSVFYLQVLKRLKRRVARVRADIKTMVRHLHDNAPTAFIITNFLVVLQPPYSPHLAPCDYFLFPRLKKRDLKYLEPMKNIQQHVTTFLRDISVEDFQAW